MERWMIQHFYKANQAQMKTWDFCHFLLSVLSWSVSTSLSLSSYSSNTDTTLSPSTSTSLVFCQTFWSYSPQCFFKILSAIIKVKSGPRTVSSWTLSATQRDSPCSPTSPPPRWIGSISGIIILYPVYQVDRFLALYWNAEYKERVTTRQVAASGLRHLVQIQSLI